MNRRQFTWAAACICNSVPARVARALEPLQMGPKSIQAVPDKATPLHVAYVPVIGSAALLVFVGSGMAKAAGLDIALTAIDNAKPGQPALRSYDALAVAVSALAKARIAGDDLRIIASLATAGAGFVAVPALAIHFYAAGGDPAKALAAFKAKTGAMRVSPRRGPAPFRGCFSKAGYSSATPSRATSSRSRCRTTRASRQRSSAARSMPRR